MKTIRLKGKPIRIHSQKLISIPNVLSSVPAICVLGGEPTSVAIPPILAAYATVSISNNENRLDSSLSFWA